MKSASSNDNMTNVQLSNMNASSGIPTAPYPPFHSMSAPLQAPPTLPDHNVNNLTTSARRQLGVSTVANMNSTSFGSNFGSANNDFTKNSSAAIQFSPVHQDVYACVNCLPHYSNRHNGGIDDYHEKMNSQQQPPIFSSKTETTLLEIRQLERIQDSQVGYFSRSRLLAVSRGTSDLKGTVSTCISFRPSSLDQDSNNTIQPNQVLNNYNNEKTLFVATGLDNGALCIHTFPNLMEAASSPPTSSSSPIQSSNLRYYHPNRQHRLSTCVAWAPSAPSQRTSQLIAIGLQTHNFSKRSSRSDREACCLVWDVEQHMGNTSLAGGNIVNSAGHVSNGGGAGRGPVHKYAHHSGVSSLTWLPSLSPIAGQGQMLLVGCQSRQIQLYDLRVSGGTIQPISIVAHSDAVNGIKVDPHRPHLFASFSKQTSSGLPFDPVKVWDVRNLKERVGEIKTGGDVSDIGWSAVFIGTLAVAMGDTIRYYDTLSSTARPVLNRMSQCNEPIECMAFRPLRVQTVESNVSGNKKANLSEQSKNDKHKTELPPLRMLAVSKRGRVYDLAKFQIAPLSISSRDGGVSHTSGRTVWIGKSSNGASSMENLDYNESEDISATMMRRARCLHAARYSTDAAANLQMLSEEDSDFNEINQIEEQHAGNQDRSEVEAQSPPFNNREALWRLWNWIERVEMLSNEREDTPSTNNVNSGTPPSALKQSKREERIWKANGLIDAGVSRLLKMDIEEDVDDYHLMDVTTFSEVLGCDTYDSPMRNTALIACGWVNRLGLHSILVDCEARDYFERSAALATFHGELEYAVTALQQGADVLKNNLIEEKDNRSSSDIAKLSRYAEVLQLVAMCIAGYGGSMFGGDSTKNLWRISCEGLLRRSEFSKKNSYGGVPYLRSICVFLCNIGKQQENWYEEILHDEKLSLCDRVAFACRFLTRKALRAFLERCMYRCMTGGNVEGIMITGLGKQGIQLLQAYVDRYSDVQTAALVSSRVILPSSWVKERAACSEWLDSYRNLLNTWQMWQSRAMFDVGRAELLRHIVNKQQQEKDRYASNSASGRSSSSHHSNTRRVGINTVRKQPSFSTSRQGDTNRFVPSSPPQVYARCNFCNVGLPLNKLRRQEGMANSWLSRQKPVLSSCPQCRNPLPRCSVCLLPLGCLNPYLELKRERNNASRAAIYGSSMNTSSNSLNNGLDSDDLSGLTNLPFAEWWSWCMRCKHGGHAHHLVGWFANHDACPVSNCDCRCQFDGIEKLDRPALVKDKK